MSATTEGTGAAEDRDHGHSFCLFCGNRNPRSLNLAFDDSEDGGVRAQFEADPGLQGYEGILHGGVIAALLDAAMTHCLFHLGIQAVTGDLHVRYARTVPCRGVLDIRARVVSSRPPLDRLEAEIIRNGCLMARAEARFIRRKRGPGPVTGGDRHTRSGPS